MPWGRASRNIAGTFSREAAEHAEKGARKRADHGSPWQCVRRSRQLILGRSSAPKAHTMAAWVNECASTDPGSSALKAQVMGAHGDAMGFDGSNNFEP
ncbi:MAG: hypothetical protein HS122_07870 [Opitutaceae bacterium]|nr:hypothetical protein [Opitutaceae bacterium]